MTPPNSIKVEGLRDFQRELRALDKSWPKELRLANKSAAELVARAAATKATSLGGVARKSAPSIKALAQQRSASVKIGGNRWAFALGAEFGGGKYGAGNPTPGGGYTTQFGRFVKTGRFLYPTIADKTEEVIETYGQAVDRLVKRAFPN